MSIEEYVASHKVNPLILPPVDLHIMLVNVKHDMRTNPQLELPHDPDRNILSYFSIMEKTAVMGDNLLFILIIPFIHRPLQIDLYIVLNLPALHPDLDVHFSYIVEGQCFAIPEYGLYAADKTEYDIRICMTTEGYLCMLNQALYPVGTLEWCVYTLYICDRDRIN